MASDDNDFSEEDPDLINFNAGKLFIHDPLALERKMSAYFRRARRVR